VISQPVAVKCGGALVALAIRHWNDACDLASRATGLTQAVVHLLVQKRVAPQMAGTVLLQRQHGLYQTSISLLTQAGTLALGVNSVASAAVCRLTIVCTIALGSSASTTQTLHQRASGHPLLQTMACGMLWRWAVGLQPTSSIPRATQGRLVGPRAGSQTTDSGQTSKTNAGPSDILVRIRRSIAGAQVKNLDVAGGPWVAGEGDFPGLVPFRFR
jgi:hypothetical protein